MEIRRATVADIETIVTLRRDFAESQRPVDPQVWATVAAPLRDFCAARLPGGDFVVMLGEEGGQVVCGAFLEMLRRPPGDNNPTGVEGYISNVFTRPQSRGRGHAGRLLTELMRQGEAAGARKFRLMAAPMGAPVYLKLGFEDDECPTMHRTAGAPLPAEVPQC